MTAPKIKRGDDFECYDIYDCDNYTLTALEDIDEDGVVKAEFDDEYILYAQWDEDEQYFEIDTGDAR